MNDMNWTAVYPEIVVLTMACVIALVDLFVKDPRRTVTYLLTLATLVVAGGMELAYFSGSYLEGATVYAMQGMAVNDAMGNLLEFFAVLSTLVTLVYSRGYAGERDMLRGGELFTLSLFSLLGIMVMISGNNFLAIYLGLELMTLSLYALVALRRDHILSTEAAMKYFVLGALASGFLLYGLSMMYGATGSLDINEVFRAIGTGQINEQVLVFGIVFVVAGLGFKLGAAPFHMWIPDVYHGAPTAVTLLIAGAPKLAAFAITIRLLVEGMLGLAPDWQQMLIVLAVVSLVVGNLVAIAQTNLKRMLAYSTIGQMGFMLLGLSCRRGERQHAVGPQRLQLGAVLHDHLRDHHAGHLRPHHAAGARRLRGRRDRGPQGPQPAQPLVCRRDGDLHVLAGGRAAAGGLLRQARGAAGAGLDQRLAVCLAGGDRRDAVAGGRVLLPAHRQGDVLRRGR